MVRTKKEEKLWSEAKKAARDSRGYDSVKDLKGELDWGLVQKIYQAKKAKYGSNPAMGSFDAVSDIAQPFAWILLIGLGYYLITRNEGL